MSEPLDKSVNIYIYTTGRKSGEQRRAHLWFAHEDGRVYMLSIVYEGERHTAWYRNLEADAKCVLLVDDSRYWGEAESLAADAELEARIREMIKAKYGAGPYGRYFGDDPMMPVVIRITGEAPEDAAAKPYAEV